MQRSFRAVHQPSIERAIPGDWNEPLGIARRRLRARRTDSWIPCEVTWADFLASKNVPFSDTRFASPPHYASTRRPGSGRHRRPRVAKPVPETSTLLPETCGVAGARSLATFRTTPSAVAASMSPVDGVRSLDGPRGHDSGRHRSRATVRTRAGRRPYKIPYESRAVRPETRKRSLGRSPTPLIRRPPNVRRRVPRGRKRVPTRKRSLVHQARSATLFSPRTGRSPLRRIATPGTALPYGARTTARRSSRHGLDARGGRRRNRGSPSAPTRATTHEDSWMSVARSASRRTLHSTRRGGGQPSTLAPLGIRATG